MKSFRLSAGLIVTIAASCAGSSIQAAEPAKPATAPTKSAAAKPAEVAVATPAAKSAPPVGVKPLDWAQWGGNPARNNVPQGKNIPTQWNIGAFDRKTGEWLKDKAENIKWAARLGSQSYGNPVVANGKVYVGTNNGNGYLKRYPASLDLGVLLCFDDRDGKFLWQHSSEKLPTGRVHDWPLQGVCAAPLIEGERGWFVTNRGEVICFDTDGFYDGEDDGPVKGEWAWQFDIMKNEDAKLDQFAPTLAALKGGKLTDGIRKEFVRLGTPMSENVKVVADKDGKTFTFQTKVDKSDRDFRIMAVGPKLVAAKLITPDDKLEADTIWRVDMMKQLGISQHNMCNCSVTAVGDILFVNTSNGVDEGHINLPAPQAPTFVAMDKNTGKVLWTDNSPGTNVLHGQWSSPAYAVINGVPQVIFGGGDGWVYSFLGEATKDGKAQLLWKFDCNPKESKYALGGRADRNHIIATPVIYNDLVYVGVGEDPEHGEGIGHLWCIDPTKKGDVSAELAFNTKDLSKPIPHRRMQAVVKEEGEVARPNPNTAAVWHYSTYDLNKNGKIAFEETMHRTCGTVAIKNDLLFIADFSGLFHCVDAKTGVPHWTHDMLAAAWGSPLIVDDKVYIGDEDGDVAVFALSAEKDLIEENSMGNSVYSTPIVANNVLYIANKDYIFAIVNESSSDDDAAAETKSK